MHAMCHGGAEPGQYDNRHAIDKVARVVIYQGHVRNYGKGHQVQGSRMLGCRRAAQDRGYRGGDPSCTRGQDPNPLHRQVASSVDLFFFFIFSASLLTLSILQRHLPHR